MSTIAWALIWVAVLATVVFFVVRERRSGRKGPADFDRTRHEAVQQSSMQAQTHGPGTAGMIGGP